MKYLLIILLFIPKYSSADEYRYIDTLNQLNEAGFGIFKFKNQCRDDDGLFNSSDEESDSKLFKQCAMDLCGAPKDFHSAYLLDFNFDQYVSDGVMERFETVEGKVREMAEAEIVKNQNLIKSFKLRIAENEFLLDFSKWEEWEYEQLTYTVFNEHLEVKVDKKLEYSKRLTITVNYPEDASDIFKKALDSYAEKKKLKVENSFSAGIYQGFYTIEEAKLKLKGQFDEMMNTLSEEKHKNPKFMDNDPRSLAIIKKLKEKILSGNFEDIYDMGSSADDLSNVSNQIIFIKTGIWPESENFNTCEKVECKQGIQEYIRKKDFKKMYEELEKRNNAKNLILDKLAYCKSELAMNGLKEYDKEEFKKIIPEIKKKFINNVLKYYSADSKNRFESYLSNELNLSFDGEESNGGIDKFIEDISKRYKSFKENVPKQIDFSEKDSKFYLTEMLNKLEGDVPNPLRNLSICYSSGFVAWDAFATNEMLADDGTEKVGSDVDITKDNLFVSMFSCSSHQHGKGIVAHELGHALSWAFADNRLSEVSFGKYKKLRTCATNLYLDGGIEYNSPLFSHEGDMHRTEEDTADLISFIAYPNNNVLYQCALLEPTANGETYENVSLHNNEKIDSHSSSLLRVLQEAIHKEKAIPKSCQNVIGKYKNKYRFKTCF